MRFLTSILLFLVSAMLVSGLVPGAASAKRQFSEAEIHYREGGRLYRAHHYGAAIVEYERALALGGEPETLYDLGQAHKMAGHLEQALMCFRLFNRLSPMSPLRFMVRSQVAQVRSKLARTGMKPPAEDDAPVTLPSPPTPTPEPPMVAAAPIVVPPPAANLPAAAPAVVAEPSPAPVVVAPVVAAPVLAAPVVAPPSAVVEKETIAPNFEPSEAPSPVEAPLRTDRAHEVASASATPPPAKESPRAEVVEPARAPITAVPASVPPAPAEPTVPFYRDRLQAPGAALVVGGAALLGAGIGFAIWSGQQSNAIDQSVRFDPSVESDGRSFAVAGAVLSIAGAAALLVGGELFRRHSMTRPERAAAAGEPKAPAPAPALSLAPGGVGFAF